MDRTAAVALLNTDYSKLSDVGIVLETCPEKPCRRTLLLVLISGITTNVKILKSISRNAYNDLLLFGDTSKNVHKIILRMTTDNMKDQCNS